MAIISPTGSEYICRFGCVVLCILFVSNVLSNESPEKLSDRIHQYPIYHRKVFKVLSIEKHKFSLFMRKFTLRTNVDICAHCKWLFGSSIQLIKVIDCSKCTEYIMLFVICTRVLPNSFHRINGRSVPAHKYTHNTHTHSQTSIRACTHLTALVYAMSKSLETIK